MDGMLLQLWNTYLEDIVMDSEGTDSTLNDCYYIMPTDYSILCSSTS
jgi:hypothetical protein